MNAVACSVCVGGSNVSWVQCMAGNMLVTGRFGRRAMGGGNNPSGSLTNNAMLAALDGDGALGEADAMAASNGKSPVAGQCYGSQVPNGA